MRGRAWLTAGTLVAAVVVVPAISAQAGSKTCDVFQGRISTDWFTAGNWSLRHVPTYADAVCLPNKRDPVINSGTQTAKAGTLTVSNQGMFVAETPIDVSGDVMVENLSVVSTANMTAAGVYGGYRTTKIILGDNTDIGSDGIQVEGAFDALGTTNVTVKGGVDLIGEQANNRYTGTAHLCGTNLIDIDLSGDINYFPKACPGAIRILALEVQDGGVYSTAPTTTLTVDGAVTLDSGSAIRVYGPHESTTSGTIISANSVDGTFTALEHAQPGTVTYTKTEVRYAPVS